MIIKLIILIAFFQLIIADQCSMPDNSRLDCYPEDGANQDDCIKRQCCWYGPTNRLNKFSDVPIDVPYCYYPNNFPVYYVENVKQNKVGLSAILYKNKTNYLKNDILKLHLFIMYEKEYRLRIKIIDASSLRYEVPIDLDPPNPQPPTNPNYQIFMSTSGPFSLEIRRKSDNMMLFKTVNPLLYSDQYIELPMQLSVDKGYGIGEQNVNLMHNFKDGWKRMGFWNRDNPIDVNINLYGTHPFFIGLPNNGSTFGMYFHNSNAQEFVTQPSSILTYRTTGGIIDLFIFTGDTPKKTVQQYIELIGKPMLQPFWSLGFHLCRYGYKSIDQVQSTLERNLKLNIPIEVQWSDIDYMDSYRDFTIDNTKYKGMGDFVRKIQSQYKIKYVVILDPGIYDGNDKGNYPPKDDGIAMNVFIKDERTGKPLEGSVWPGHTYYPDFTHPNATNYWTKQIQRFMADVPVDGLWIDMNEPSNFEQGSTTGCAQNSINYPAFIPIIRDRSLVAKTVCPSALHYKNVQHYNLHNLYGYGEAVATNAALRKLKPNQRPFVLSRSTFAGSGVYTSHWTGDNRADWSQMEHSIRQILNMNMFGIPMVGADICGFLGNADEEQCIRWMQLGAFYPFMRNHNDVSSPDQDPAVWSSEAQEIIKKAIYIRYSLLPYMYSLHIKSHLYGDTVVRPLSFEFPSDITTHSIETQFMFGPSLLVSPVLTANTRSIDAYFPAGIWYDLEGGKMISNSTTGQWFKNFSAPLNKINVAIRGGSIFLLTLPRMTTEEMKTSPLEIVCSLDESGNAQGDMYYDDGVTGDNFITKKYNKFNFTANSNSFKWNPQYLGTNVTNDIEAFVVLGLKNDKITNVTVDGKNVPFFFKDQILSVANLKMDMTKIININWK